MSQDPKPKNETVTLSVAEIEAMMQRVVDKTRAEMAPPTAPLPDPKFAGYTADERAFLEKIRMAPKPLPLTYVPCVSRPEYGGTGARWLAAVVPATVRNGKAIPERVVELLSYTKPEGWDRTVSESNPFGLAEGVGQRLPNGDLTRRAKHGVYERFWQTDLRANIGRPVNPGYRMNEDETKRAAFVIPSAEQAA